MYDSFYFEDGFLPADELGGEFQTKCLGCDLIKYRVDRHGNITAFDYEGAPLGCEIEAATVTVYNYIKDYSTEQKYQLVIVDNKIRRAEKQ